MVSHLCAPPPHSKPVPPRDSATPDVFERLPSLDIPAKKTFSPRFRSGQTASMLHPPCLPRVPSTPQPVLSHPPPPLSGSDLTLLIKTRAQIHQLQPHFLWKYAIINNNVPLSLWAVPIPRNISLGKGESASNKKLFPHVCSSFTFQGVRPFFSTTSAVKGSGPSTSPERASKAGR